MPKTLLMASSPAPAADPRARLAAAAGNARRAVQDGLSNVSEVTTHLSAQAKRRWASACDVARSSLGPVRNVARAAAQHPTCGALLASVTMSHSSAAGSSDAGGEPAASGAPLRRRRSAASAGDDGLQFVRDDSGGGDGLEVRRPNGRCAS